MPFLALARRGLVVAGAVVALASAQQPRLAYVGDGPEHQMGRALAGGRDVNLDGKNDFVCGARGLASSPTFPGRAYLFSGNGAFIRTFTGAAPGDEFGCSVALLGDVTGDGSADLLIGARSADGPAGVNSGRAYLYRGESPAHACDYTLVAVFDSPAAGASFGQSVADLGDLDGDGIGDFGIGASYAPTSASPGVLVVYSGATLLPVGSVSLGQSGDLFGYACVGAGDVDGDGYRDFAVSAATYDVAGPIVNAGRVTIFRGFTAGALANFSVVRHYDGEQAFQFFGVSLAGGSDLDGDGVPDILVGSNQFDAAGATVAENRGKAYVYSGANGALVFQREGDEVKDWFGIGVSMAGDLDRDGVNEFLVGACETEKGGKGKAYAFRVGSTTPVFKILGEAGSGLPSQGDAFGFSVATATDLDGDATPEFLVGAYGYDGFGGSNAGKAYLYSSALRRTGVEFPPPHVLSLKATAWPKLGTTFSVRVTGAPPWTLGLLGFSPATSVTPFFGGTLLLDPSFVYLFYVLADASGVADFPIAVPTDAAFLNLTAHFQAAFFDPSQPFLLAQSNLLTLVTFL